MSVLAAKCQTAAAPVNAGSNAFGSRRSATKSSIRSGPPLEGRCSFRPAERLSTTRTVSPRSSSARTRDEPIAPAPPVTTVGPSRGATVMAAAQRRGSIYKRRPA